jgi:hypothetical protein
MSKPTTGNRRSKTKFRALIPALNLKTRYEEIADLASYAKTLSIEDREWLNRFSEEYINASFNKDPRKRLHKRKSQLREIYNRNNARNRDIFTKEKAQGTMNYMEDILRLKIDEKKLKIDRNEIDEDDEDVTF